MVGAVGRRARRPGGALSSSVAFYMRTCIEIIKLPADARAPPSPLHPRRLPLEAAQTVEAMFARVCRVCAKEIHRAGRSCLAVAEDLRPFRRSQATSLVSLFQFSDRLKPFCLHERIHTAGQDDEFDEECTDDRC